MTGEALPSAGAATSEPGGRPTVQVVRTIPERSTTRCPDGDFGILESYLGALRSATSLVYLENQFLWSPEIAAVLREKLERPPSTDFRLVLVLPAKPASGADDTRGTLAELVEADDGAGRLLACTLYARAGRARRPVYVHAKIGIVDDRWLTIGSANLNEHSLFNDTEMNVVTHDEDLARSTRLRLWAEHLELTEAAVAGDPAEVVDRLWRPVAEEQLRRRQQGAPLTHRLVLLPGVSRSLGAAARPAAGAARRRLAPARSPADGVR